MRHTRIASIAVLSAFLLAAEAGAQPHRFYVGGGIIADNDQTNSSLSEATLTSWTLVLGFDASSHLGIRGVFEAPHEASQSFEGTYTRPPSIFPVHEQTTRTNRTKTYGLLADIHGQIAPALRLAGTFGFMTVTHDTTFFSVRTELRPDGTRVSLPDFRHDGDFDWFGLALGLEAALTLGRRLELVPEVRMIYFGPYESHPYIIRSGVGARWRF